MIPNCYMKSLIIVTALFFGAMETYGQRNNEQVPANDIDLNTIVYIANEDPIVLDFDHYLYLPENFNPYHGMVLELEDIVYLECDDENDFEPVLLLP